MHKSKTVLAAAIALTTAAGEGGAPRDEGPVSVEVWSESIPYAFGPRGSARCAPVRLATFCLSFDWLCAEADRPGPAADRIERALSAHDDVVCYV